MANQYTNGWTSQEIEILKEYAGVLSYKDISKKLNFKRSEKAIEKKLYTMGLTSTKELSSLITVHHLSKVLGIDNKVVYKWVERKDLPVSTHNFRETKENKRTCKYIDVLKFWDWAEKNKELINWSKVETKILVPEPEWFYKKRKEDYYKKPSKRPWDYNEDYQLWTNYYVKGKKIKEIAGMMDRTVPSIEGRLRKLRKQEFHRQVDKTIKLAIENQKTNIKNLVIFKKEENVI